MRAGEYIKKARLKMNLKVASHAAARYETRSIFARKFQRICSKKHEILTFLSGRLSDFKVLTFNYYLGNTLISCLRSRFRTVSSLCLLSSFFNSAVFTLIPGSSGTSDETCLPEFGTSSATMTKFYVSGRRLTFGALSLSEHSASLDETA